jgi:hypothetical protein
MALYFKASAEELNIGVVEYVETVMKPDPAFIKRGYGIVSLYLIKYFTSFHGASVNKYFICRYHDLKDGNPV